MSGQRRLVARSRGTATTVVRRATRPCSVHYQLVPVVLLHLPSCAGAVVKRVTSRLSATIVKCGAHVVRQPHTVQLAVWRDNVIRRMCSRPHFSKVVEASRGGRGSRSVVELVGVAWRRCVSYVVGLVAVEGHRSISR